MSENSTTGPAVIPEMQVYIAQLSMKSEHAAQLTLAGLAGKELAALSIAITHAVEAAAMRQRGVD